MTTAPIEATPNNIKTPRIDVVNVREVTPTTFKGMPALEFDLRARGKYHITSAELTLLALLDPVGISYHGSKFYFNTALLPFDVPLPIYLELEILNQFGGRKLKSARLLPPDAVPPIGMTDDEFAKAWDAASAVAPPLERVSADPKMWNERLFKIVVRFYSMQGYGPNKGKDAAEFISAALTKREVRLAQDLLKKRVREDFPEGKPMPPKKETAPKKEFDKAGDASDIGMRIVEGAKARKLETGPALELKILGDRAEKFVTSPQSYKAALSMVEHYFANLDEESAFLLGLSKNEAEVGSGLTVEELSHISEAIQLEHTGGTTDSLLDVPGYDRALVLAAHRSAIEAFKVKDVPKFENGIKDQTDPTPPPDEVKDPEPAKALTADDWKTWREERATDLNLGAIEIDTLLGITKDKTYRRFATLEDGNLALKSAMAKQKLLMEIARITREFGVPDDVSLRWIDEGYDKTKGETLEEVAGNWRTNEQFLASIKSKAVEYQAQKSVEPSPSLALVPASPPPTSLRLIPVPNPNEMSAMKELALIAGDTRFYKGITNYGQAMMVMYTGFELGLGLTFSLRHIPIVNGTPWPDAECHRALALKSGFVEWLDVKGDANQATCSIRRKGQTEIQTVTYTIEDAQKAGLTGKDTYKSHPADMLVARATIRAVRRFVPEAGAGIIGDTDNVIPDEDAAA